MKHKIITSDVLIIGGGTAGCYAGIELSKNRNIKIVIAEKADIRRSGCLAAGVNALNAYITKGHTPMDYVNYASVDAESIVREDLLLDISNLFNEVTHDLEKRGLTILKDENGEYVSRGWRNLKINGENIKTILSKGVTDKENIDVYNHVNITDFIHEAGQVKGAYGFGILDGNFYEFRAKAVLVSTGGAAGLYRPNNPGETAHQMWYCPFNTGAGFGMGILCGAEMTTFEMRFIALRCKDTIAPTGTLAQGAGARQINANGEIYEEKYGLTTSQRLWGTVKENLEGRGPCYLKTKGIGKDKEEKLYKAYLNMAPLQTLKWIETNLGPDSENVEIEGTEPYIVGGHTASGYWINRDRSTTLRGLFAAGDVAGGAPQKYVTGALAEGKIAAKGIEDYIGNLKENENVDCFSAEKASAKKKEYEDYLSDKESLFFTGEQIEEAMQKVMDEYAGGIKNNYSYSEKGLLIAEKKIKDLQDKLRKVRASDMDELLEIYEVRERLIVAETLIAHLKARKETRWHCFQENADYPQIKSEFECYINSVRKNDGIHIIKRNLIKVKET